MLGLIAEKMANTKANNAPSTAVKARWRTAGTMMGMLFRAVKWDAMRSPGAGRKVKMRLPRLATRVGSRKVQDPADDSCQEHSQGFPPVETRHRRCVDGVGACGVQGFYLREIGRPARSWCPRAGGRLLPGFSSSPADSGSRSPHSRWSP